MGRVRSGICHSAAGTDGNRAGARTFPRHAEAKETLLQKQKQICRFYAGSLRRGSGKGTSFLHCFEATISCYLFLVQEGFPTPQSRVAPASPNQAQGCARQSPMASVCTWTGIRPSAAAGGREEPVWEGQLRSQQARQAQARHPIEATILGFEI